MSKEKTIAGRPRLGRGLSSLIVNSSQPAGEVPTAEAKVASQMKPVVVEEKPVDGAALTVEIDRITPNPYQPRREFTETELKELSESIALQGILQPLVVAAKDGGDGFVLIAGERRLRAAKLAGLTKVPCILRQASRQQMLEWALIENIQRSDLNAIERGMAYRDFMDRFNLTQAEAAGRLGEPRTSLANYLRMLDLCDEVQLMLIEGKLSFGHGKVLASLATQPDRQLAVAKRVVGEGLTVRQLEQLLEKGDAAAEAAGAKEMARTRPAYLMDLEDQLTKVVGTAVKILPGRGKHTGRIVIDYYSLDDFDRIAGDLGLKIEE